MNKLIRIMKGKKERRSSAAFICYKELLGTRLKPKLYQQFQPKDRPVSRAARFGRFTAGTKEKDDGT